MTQLLLIRHGQASFGADNYDQLSNLGELQARAVGRALRNSTALPSMAFSGQLVRQRRTADLALAAADCELAIHAVRAFDEYDSEAIFGTYLPEVLDEMPDIKKRVSATGHSIFKEPGVFRRVFYPVMNKWIAGENPGSATMEPWVEFRKRVLEGVDAVTTRLPAGHTAAIFTSGGVISVVLAHALGLRAVDSIDYNWRTANGSITHLSLSGQELSLQSYNHHAHLDDPAAGLSVTYL